MPQVTVLEVFSDYVCPWCYLSTRRIQRLQRAFAIDIQWVHFPLHPETPSEGLSLETLFGRNRVEVEKMNARMNTLMAAEHLPFRPRTHTYNSRLAQELVSWAETQPRNNTLHDGLFRAYFADGKNIGRIDTLVDLANSAGLSVALARQVLEERSFESVVDADWEKCRASGVTGVPTFMLLGQRLVGAHPYETLADFVERLGVKRKDSRL